MSSAKHLKAKVVEGVLWSFVGSSGYQILGLFIFVILSRNLSPADFGVMAIAVVFIELLSTIVRMGMMEGIVREKELKEEGINTVFWVTFCAGFFFSVATYLFAEPAAVIFDVPLLADILKILSILPFLHALGTVYEGLLQRDYKFKSLALRTLIATATSGLVGISLALNGYGVYSLVWQRVLSVVILTALLFYYVRFVPQAVFSYTAAKKLSFMGAPIMMTSLVAMGTVKVANLFVGFFLGPAAVGYLHLAGKLHDFVVQFTIKPIADVSLTTFSKLQENHAELGKTYRKLVQFCIMFALPAFLGFAAVSSGLIEFVFGEQWAPAVPLIQILCFASLSAALNYFFRPLMISVGEGKLVLKIGILHFGLTAVAAFFTAQISIVAVMLGYLAVSIVVTIATLYAMQRKIGVHISQLFFDLYPPVLMSVLMAGLLFFVRFFVGDSLSTLMLTGLLILLGALFYVGGAFLLFPQLVKQVKSTFSPLIAAKFKRDA